VRCRFHGLRQQAEKEGDEPHACLSDFVAPKGAGVADYLGMFACTAGLGLETLIARRAPFSFCGLHPAHLLARRRAHSLAASLASLRAVGLARPSLEPCTLQPPHQQPHHHKLTTQQPTHQPTNTTNDQHNRYKADGDDYSYIMAEALADRLAEAFAEKLHELARRQDWGYAPGESLSVEDMLKAR